MRIEFIDIAKGLCILLVVMIHVGVPEYIPGLYAAKVPIFFTLSGLFFLKKSHINEEYAIKAVDTLLIPFIVYYLLSYCVFYSLDYTMPEVIVGNTTFSIKDLWTQRNLFNGPLWFLISLFEVEVVFWLLCKYIKNDVLLGGVVIGFTAIGFYLSVTETFCPFWLDTSLVALFFFYIGYLLSKTSFLHKRISYTKLIIACILLYVCSLAMPVSIYMSVNSYSNCLLTLFTGSMLVIFILLLCKMIGNAPVLSWIGMNSMIILCTHHMIYRPIKYAQLRMGLESPELLFIFTIILEIPIIILINKYAPLLAGKMKILRSCSVRQRI